MPENNIILNRFFTQNVIFDLMRHSENNTYGAVVRRYVNDAHDKNNGMLISEIYRFMSKHYRNEYFYQNTLLNKLLLGKHSITTTTALTQIPICKSKADFILINGKAVVYEIKTELWRDEALLDEKSQYERAMDLLSNTPVGVYVLTDNNTISVKKRKEPSMDNSQLDYTSIFKILHKEEFESILANYFGELPRATQAFYYGECLSKFSQIPIMVAYAMVLKELKKRNRVLISDFKDVPYELKSIMYFANTKKTDWAALSSFLKEKYGG